MTIQKIKCYQTDYRKNEYFLDVTDKQKSIKTDGTFTTIYLNPNRKNKGLSVSEEPLRKVPRTFITTATTKRKSGLSKATSDKTA